MRLPDGSYRAKVDDFAVMLLPKSKGRWKFPMIHEGGYMARWPDSLDAAKAMALLTLRTAQDTLVKFGMEEARKRANPRAQRPWRLCRKVRAKTWPNGDVSGIL